MTDQSNSEARDAPMASKRNSVRNKLRGRVLLLCLLAAGWILWLQTHGHEPQVWYDSSEVELLAVTQGPAHICYPGGIWDRLLGSLLPGQGIHFGGWNYQPIPPITNSWMTVGGKEAATDSMVIWLKHLGETEATPAQTAWPVNLIDQWYKKIRAEVIDQNGIPWELPQHGQVYPVGRRGIDFVSAWRFPMFPRRHKSARLRFYYMQRTGAWMRMMDIDVPNPDRGPHATWNPEPLPITHDSEDLTVSLVKFVSGIKTVEKAFGFSGERPYTQARFEIRRHGEIITNWLPTRITAVDATRNEGFPAGSNQGITNGLCFYEIQGLCLSPSETWKVAATFAQQSGFKPEEILTLPGIPASNGLLAHREITTNLLGEELFFKCQGDHFTIRRKTPKAGRAIEILRLIDQSGKSVHIGAGRRGADLQDLDLRIPLSAESVTMSFVLKETRSFEFLAQPVNAGLEPIHASAKSR